MGRCRRRWGRDSEGHRLSIVQDVETRRLFGLLSFFACDSGGIGPNAKPQYRVTQRQLSSCSDSYTIQVQPWTIKVLTYCQSPDDALGEPDLVRIYAPSPSEDNIGLLGPRSCHVTFPFYSQFWVVSHWTGLPTSGIHLVYCCSACHCTGNVAPVLGLGVKKLQPTQVVNMSRPRFELRTFCVLDRCDNQLRHRPYDSDGPV